MVIHFEILSKILKKRKTHSVVCEEQPTIGCEEHDCLLERSWFPCDGSGPETQMVNPLKIFDLGYNSGD
jgi:hypothetical protein